MGQRRGARGSKYSDDFKRRLVAEIRADGVSVPMVSRRHDVPTSRIYSWRRDARFQADASEDAAFIPVAVANSDTDAAPVLREAQPTPLLTSPARIEITLENGRKLSVFDGSAQDALAQTETVEFENQTCRLSK